MSGTDGDFLARWSARKQKARTEPELEAAPPAEPEPAAALATEPEGTDEEILRELGLPDPDSLVKGDSVAGFLKAGVPARLRHRALRRLWLTDPVFANLDGLNDYEEDFTDAATVVQGMKTAYRVGRGLLPDEPTETAEAVAADEGAPETTVDRIASEGTPADGEAGGEAAADPGAGAADAPDAEPEVAGVQGESDDAPAEGAEPGEEPLLPPRRMRFHFDAG